MKKNVKGSSIILVQVFEIQIFFLFRPFSMFVPILSLWLLDYSYLSRPDLATATWLTLDIHKKLTPTQFFYAKITLFLPQLPPTYPLLVRLILKTTCKVWQWPVFIYSQSTWWKLKLLLTSLMLVIVSIVITVEGEVGQVTYRQYNHCVLLGIE